MAVTKGVSLRRTQRLYPRRWGVYENRSITGLDNVWWMWWRHNGNLVRKWQQQANSHCLRILLNIPWEFWQLLGRDKRVVRGFKSCVSTESITSMLIWAYLHTNKHLSQRLIPICNYEFVFLCSIHVAYCIINHLRAENLFQTLIFWHQVATS